MGAIADLSQNIEGVSERSLRKHLGTLGDDAISPRHHPDPLTDMEVKEVNGNGLAVNIEGDLLSDPLLTHILTHKTCLPMSANFSRIVTAECRFQTVGSPSESPQKTAKPCAMAGF